MRNGKPKAIPSVAELDMRDYFAAKAMQASMMHSLPCSATDMKGIARDCYYMADAMLKAREGA